MRKKMISIMLCATMVMVSLMGCGCSYHYLFDRKPCNERRIYYERCEYGA